ncbi:MAG TPA: DUF3095 domain-containing protein [Burkholderiales bacterium]|nr:DUF3095 domain-containing protein [Burkholderiales bacterium]
MPVGARDSIHFYRDLPPVLSFAKAMQGRVHADVPADWWIVIADVVGSTKAIQAGDYKKVNTVGVACIAAVANVDRAVDLPFIFGGDGATFAVPDALRERVIVALRAAQALAREGFGLALRVGLVRVSELVGQNFWVRLGKVRLSEYVTQPLLSGRGWNEAERRVKTPGSAGVLRVEEKDGPADGSFDGFECRWQNVPSFQDHKLSLLVAAISPEADVNFSTYQRVLEKIQAIYGDVEHYHPLRVERMQLTFSPRMLSHEWRVRSARRGILRRAEYFLQMVLKNLAGRVIFARNIDTRAVKWSRYRSDLVENSDFRKFDGMLRMVMDGKNAQAEELKSFLEAECRDKRLVYGMHKSREALLTCIVQSYNGNHLHFVDGSDGGYALAARDLKQRLSAAFEPA